MKKKFTVIGLFVMLFFGGFVTNGVAFSGFTSSLSGSSKAIYQTRRKGVKSRQKFIIHRNSGKTRRAVCRDGSISFSRNRRGTCSRHGGVARWY